MGFLEQLQALREQRSATVARINNATTNEALDAIEVELRRYDMQIVQVQSQMQAAGVTEDGEDPEARSNEPQVTGGFTPVATISSRKQGAENTDDMFGTLEYRNAFKNYIVAGTPIPEQYRQEQRSAEMTVVGDVAAVIPTTIMNKVIEDLTVEGKILSRVTQTSVQGGVSIPISEIMPTAQWLSSENEVSEEQKAKMEAKLQFGYHVLEARVGIGLLSATVSLPIFESTVVKQLKKAMIKAIEISIIAGSGNGQPLGLTKLTIPTKQCVKFTTANIGTVAQWAKVEAALPEAYEDSNVYLMNKATWEMYLNGMTDSVGQKIGLGKINEKGQKVLNGREVITTDLLPAFDNATSGAVFGALVNLEEYLLNSNLAMYYKKYFDEDKNKWVHKALMIVDGKMAAGEVGTGESKKLVGAEGIIYLTK